MNKTPLVTVAILSYNHGKYVAKTIESILNQSFKDFELLIIDDASTDNSIEVIKKFNDPRIRLIEQKQNRGICFSGNICINEAVGKYISLFASDDIMVSDKIEKQISFLQEHPEYDVVFSGMEIIDENGKTLPKKTKRFEKFFTIQNKNVEQWLNYFFYNGNCLAAPTMIAKTEILKKIGGFDSRLSQAHDFDLWVRICLGGYNIYVLPEKLVKYRRVGNKNMSSNTATMRARLIFDNEKVLENYLSINNTHELIKIFPDLNQIKDQIDLSLIPFFVAKEALKSTNHYHIQFAINVIYKILADEEIRKKLEKDFGFFINKDFFDLVTKNPIGNLTETIRSNFCTKIARKLKKFFKL